MLNKLIPDYYYDDVSCIDLENLRKKGIKYVICDLDNTLDSHSQELPSQSSIDFLENLKNYGFEVCIISNGKLPRVKKYLSDYPLHFIAQAGKPLKKSYLKAMAEIGATPPKTVFIGDQIFTDVLGANCVGLTSILVNPIESIENLFFYIKRPLERIVKSKIVKSD